VFSALEVFYDNALYKSTFYLLTYFIVCIAYMFYVCVLNILPCITVLYCTCITVLYCTCITVLYSTCIDVLYCRPTCIDVRLLHLNKEYLLTYLAPASLRYIYNFIHPQHK